jgi:DNA-binding Lrp family transcriptional regulator
VYVDVAIRMIEDTGFPPRVRLQQRLISVQVGDAGMTDLSHDISAKIFRRTVAALKGQVSMSAKMLEVLMALDGRTALSDVARKLNLSMSDLRPHLQNLIAYGVVEEVQANMALLDPQFFGYLSGHLSRIAGPIAQVMVEDAVLEISNGSTEVPKQRAGELIDLLGRQIPDEGQRAEFIKQMLHKAKEL